MIWNLRPTPTHTYTYSQNTHAHRHTHTKSPWEKMRADSGKLWELQMNPDARSCRNFQSVSRQSWHIKDLGMKNSFSLKRNLSFWVSQTESQLKIASHTGSCQINGAVILRSFLFELQSTLTQRRAENTTDSFTSTHTSALIPAEQEVIEVLNTTHIR